MHGIKFDGCNIELGKPDGMTDEQCFSLPAMKGIDPNGFPYILTAFAPNKEDLIALQDGRPLYLKVVGTQFPPVALFTLDEDGNGNF